MKDNTARVNQSGRTKTPPITYQAGLALVSLAMAVLPCLYLAFIGLAAYGVYFFATHYFLAIWQFPARGAMGLILLVICSCTPLLVGATVTIFMIKPLFARRAKRMVPIALNSGIEPRVYQLVQDVCLAVGAVPPRRIQLDCDLNASAGFDGGFSGMLGNKLVLTLGMPLIAGLTQRELAGVIAHEFGHFRQGAGMRLSYLIRQVNGWFMRVIYERDAWDEALQGAGHTDTWWISFMVGCARFGVWISRSLLWCLMMFGHSICAFLMRQMEYDADRCQIHVAGSDTLESSFIKLSLLDSVMSDIALEMRRMWRNKFQLPDNLPLFVEFRVEQMSMEKRDRITNKVGLSKTGLLDTHPSPADRIRQARKLAEPGYDISEAPARDLFENFDMASKLVTLAHYDDNLNIPATPDFLIPIENIIRPSVPAPTEAPAPVSLPTPLMTYDPGAFQGKKGTQP